MCWKRMARHLPAGTPLRVLELEAITAYWEQDPKLTVGTVADRLRLTLDPHAERVLVGWGVGGVIAAALAERLPNPPRHVVVLDGLAPGAERPDRSELLRMFAMFLGARRGRALNLDPAKLEASKGEALEHLRESASRVGALGEATTTESLRRSFNGHARGQLRDYRLTRTYEATGIPVTVVKAARSIAPDSEALEWDQCGPVELLASGGDHYTMLTDPAPSVHLALLLQRWLGPMRVAA
jgi:pimeloyl-ACP methyl ester carboxylesterase